MDGVGSGGPAELTLDDALEIAARAHRARDVPVAEALYERILAAAPDHAAALHLYGMLLHQTNRPREAVRLIRRSIEIEPEDPSAHINLGNVFFELDRPDLAIEAYGTAITIEPGEIDARNNLGVALRVLRRPEEAEAVYREAIALDRGHRDIWNNLGRLLASQGRIEEAIAAHTRALELQPADPGTRRFLVAAYAATREHDRALAVLRDWLRDDPDDPSAQHLFAAISGKDVPERASDRYVAALFDGFAASFDHKLALLDYRAPSLVAAAVDAAHGPGADLIVLDAGCGTGLCGPALRAHARELVGVDLSGRMLDKARQRGCYDRLNAGELTRHLGDRPAAYDLVVSADTLCYFGPLDVVCTAAAGALRPGGRFVFSVEESKGEGFSLHPHGRYSHARGYVERCLAGAGFSVEVVRHEALRMERGEAVRGLVVTARRG
ncbi:putative TPR repeat methyltransferase [Methylobacterium brachiatum]|uniref:TPR repeat methyltransferase n=1 Tax=Methylobacterium brachiatum TaxID=269660 RepID=A0AAJ1X0M5_9HYPH|nr:tetratricopeptide repeat protein [Methylobacterium brachiatum]MCB4805516.1 tetratricopeptide repeat protein [Methylobacterium brachiatum]MDQ0546568.1 putative TPR repeat methyltransferase [Methylobacterium brachiatum]